MKKFFCIAGLTALSFGGFAQELEFRCDKVVPEIICVVSNHGRHYITHNGVKEDKDIKLENGNVIHSEGVLETQDHFIVMQPNRCIRVDKYIVIYAEDPIAESK